MQPLCIPDGSFQDYNVVAVSHKASESISNASASLMRRRSCFPRPGFSCGAKHDAKQLSQVCELPNQHGPRQSSNALEKKATGKIRSLSVACYLTSSHTANARLAIPVTALMIAATHAHLSSFMRISRFWT
jgi:hypothetical protein